MESKAKLFKKVLKVLSSVEAVKKSGYNSHQKYYYSTENDLLDAVRQSLIDNGIMIFTSSEYKDMKELVKKDKDGNEKRSFITVIETTHTFADIETGETFNVSSVGTGWDDTDKGAFKAVTGAMKYFVSKNFMVATEDDPENDGITPKVNSQPVKNLIKPATVKTNETKTDLLKGSDTVQDVQIKAKVEEKKEEPKVEVKESKPVKKNLFTERPKVKVEPKFP